MVEPSAAAVSCRSVYTRCLGRRLRWVALLALLAVGVGAAAASERSTKRGPRPDATFGRGAGFVTTAVPGSFAVAYAATVLPDGDIVVAGQASPPSGNGQVVVARYLPNGRLDPSFASHGIFESALPSASAPYIATALARDRGTGKLVIAGGYGQGSMLVMRLTARGRLDPTFGARRSGVATAAVGGIANSLVIQPNGGIVVGGSNANRRGRPFVVARFTPSGVLDRAFGHKGIAQARFWNGAAASSAGVNGLAIARGGGIIASGHIDYIGGTGRGKAGYGTAGIFRLTNRGLPFRAFGTAGHTQVAFPGRPGVPQSWYPCAMTVDRRGRITVTGGGGAHKSALLTARLTPRGALDRSYGEARDGRSVVPGVGGNAITTCGDASTPAGEITVGLQSTLAQVLPGGRPNVRFASGGVFTISEPRRVFINSLVRLGHRILIAGSAADKIYVGRYRLPAGSS
jgi:uncharacterized delta-60 repeat protein